MNFGKSITTKGTRKFNKLFYRRRTCISTYTWCNAQATSVSFSNDIIIKCIIRRVIIMYADELYTIHLFCFPRGPDIVALTHVIKVDIAFPTDRTHPHDSSCRVYTAQCVDTHVCVMYVRDPGGLVPPSCAIRSASVIFTAAFFRITWFASRRTSYPCRKIGKTPMVTWSMSDAFASRPRSYRSRW